MQHLMKMKVKLRRSDITISKDVKKLYGKDEYLVALREKHNLKDKDKTFKINVGDVVMINGETKNRGHWKIGLVNHLYIGKANII